MTSLLELPCTSPTMTVTESERPQHMSPTQPLALAKLDDGIEFTNELFQNTVVPDLSTRLKNLARGNSVSTNSDIFLDAPFTVTHLSRSNG